MDSNRSLYGAVALTGALVGLAVMLYVNLVITAMWPNLYDSRRVDVLLALPVFAWELLFFIIAWKGRSERWARASMIISAPLALASFAIACPRRVVLVGVPPAYTMPAVGSAMRLVRHAPNNQKCSFFSWAVGRRGLRTTATSSRMVRLAPARRKQAGDDTLTVRNNLYAWHNEGPGFPDFWNEYFRCIAVDKQDYSFMLHVSARRVRVENAFRSFDARTGEKALSPSAVTGQWYWLHSPEGKLADHITSHTSLPKRVAQGTGVAVGLSCDVQEAGFESVCGERFDLLPDGKGGAIARLMSTRPHVRARLRPAR